MSGTTESEYDHDADALGLRPEDEWDGSEIDFAGIAHELTLLEAYGERGWHAGAWNEGENVFICLAPAVRLAAEDAAGPRVEYSIDLEALNCISLYLQITADGGMLSEDKEARELIRRAEAAVDEAIARLTRQRLN